LGQNPLTKQLKAKAAQIEKLQERRADLLSDLEWHRDLDRAAAAQALEKHHATYAALEAEKADVALKLASGRQKGEELRRKASLGMNPAYWFSMERHAAKEQGA
jgi:hypothetical protein